VATPIVNARALFRRLKWPVSEKASFNIMVTFGDGEPPFSSNP
jgi:hypothetical protein